MPDSDIPMILQARTNSSRYPQKILENFAEGLCLLEFQIVRLKKAFPFSTIVVATSTSPADDIIEDIALKNNIFSFRGDEHNVLERFVSCCAHFNFTGHIIRICSDNPFLQLQLLKELIIATKANGSQDDYISYSINEAPAIRTHFGFFAEIVKVEALRRISEMAPGQFYREHVTNYIYEQYESTDPAPAAPRDRLMDRLTDRLMDRLMDRPVERAEADPRPEFTILLIELNELSAWSDMVRLTIDCPEDLENARRIYQLLGPSSHDRDIPWLRIVSLIGHNSEIRNNMKKQIQLHQK